ncbi:MAG: hypothetical protein WCT77_11645 [Bacteroidota bacterium]
MANTDPLAGKPAIGTVTEPIQATKDTPKGFKMGKATYIGSGIGTIAGAYYAFHTEKSFWGYVGFILLGSIVGSTVGGIMDNTLFKNK